MRKTFSDKFTEKLLSNLPSDEGKTLKTNIQPIHVVYGGADRFSAETPQKFGKIALRSLADFAPDFVEFARAVWLDGADTLPLFDKQIRALEDAIKTDAEAEKQKNFAAWFAHAVHTRMIRKLQNQPIEDFRIDFEDGYGFRLDSEEDAHAIQASKQLALLQKGSNPLANCGFRIKSLAAETRKRAVKTLDIFLSNFTDDLGEIPENFFVTLPKITSSDEVKTLSAFLDEFEVKNNISSGKISIELMIETPQALVNEDGFIVLPSLVKAGNGRVTSAHFGAYDFTAVFEIAGNHQHLNHGICDFARNLMQTSLAPLGVNLSDSVTTEMPVAIHKGAEIAENQHKKNIRTVQNAWRKHFNNVTRSMVNGFYQSWDLHPAQLPARYAAVYAFYLSAATNQAARLRSFIAKATEASMTGNDFDDAASAQGLVNFFRRGLNCGAFSKAEIREKLGVSAEVVLTKTFAEISESKRTRSA